MRRWARIGIAGIAVVVVGAIATGAYALVGGSDEAPKLPGFALVRPLFAQAATTTFPVADAGISAYVKVDSASVDFDQIITTVFDGIVGAGDNFIIGTVAINQGIWLSRTVSVNVYVDTDGWIVAYLTTEKPHAEVFTWTEWNPSGPTLDTTLVKAMEKTAAAIAQAINPALIGWYYWANPNATHFAAAAIAGVDDLFLAIPVQAVVYRKPSYSWHSNFLFASYQTGSLTLTKLGAPGVILEGKVSADRFSATDVDMDKGAIYTFKAADAAGGIGEHRLGVAVVYKAP